MNCSGAGAIGAPLQFCMKVVMTDRIQAAVA
jgi:hypothetical protein